MKRFTHLHLVPEATVDDAPIAGEVAKTQHDSSARNAELAALRKGRSTDGISVVLSNLRIQIPVSKGLDSSLLFGDDSCGCTVYRSTDVLDIS